MITIHSRNKAGSVAASLLLLFPAPTALAAECIPNLLRYATSLRRSFLSPELALYNRMSGQPRDRFNYELYKENFFLSRTATSGTSSRTFSSSAAEVQSRAEENAKFVFGPLNEIARKKDLTSNELFEFILGIPDRFSAGITSATNGGTTETGAKLRRFGYLPQDRGLQEEALQKDIAIRLRAFSEELFRRMQNPGADPIQVAAYAHQEISHHIKPFHDANGRTARAVVDLVLLRLGFPIPRYKFTGSADEQFKAYFATTDETTFAAFLRTSCQASLNAARGTPGVSLDFSSPVSAAASFAHPNFSPESISTIKLRNGSTVSLGRKVGEGGTSRVYCFNAECTEVIKIATNYEPTRFFAAEADHGQKLQAAGIDVPETLNALEKQPLYLVKRFAEGEPLGDVLKRGPLSRAYIKELARLFDQLSKNGLVIDQNPGNLFWNSKSKRLTVVDTGVPDEHRDWMKTIGSWHYWYFKNNGDREGFSLFVSKINRLRTNRGKNPLPVDFSIFSFGKPAG